MTYLCEYLRRPLRTEAEAAADIAAAAAKAEREAARVIIGRYVNGPRHGETITRKAARNV